MRYSFHAQGHPNVTSAHKTTFEVTMDPEIGEAADCIIGVSSEKSMLNFPEEFKKAIAKNNSSIRVVLTTKNAYDEIKGTGNVSLSLDHPTDIVCRKSDYVCSRTLMIKSDKAACDLNPLLIEDLSKGEKLNVDIIVE
ncbi:DUF371 domain-containing protein [Methanobacterium alcaliphilum]|uniref:DUF371 domain-containing protein n=1 Tax=Methanobacterium alcaliphilum TaxID=392018 RepID=UPI00200B7CB7|nr:DUF371 domain-containing protein [Methanobacterium alcaliphilum]MCK9152015.1 DUF371 domain-containing protein [Methanobacterium alcaliphilum]